MYMWVYKPNDICEWMGVILYIIRLITLRVPSKRVIIDTYIFVFRKRHHGDPAKSCPLA